MAVITPVGKEFDWSPKEQGLNKTASTEASAKTDKDLLYEVAKRVVKAQFMDLDKPIDKPVDSLPCEGVAPCDSVKGIGDVVPEGNAVKDVSAPVAESEGVRDVQKAVKELVDKANKAEEVASKVQEAVGKVEEAVQGVKDAIGGEAVEAVEGIEGEGAPDEIEIEIEDLGEDKEEKEEKGEKEEDKSEDKEDKGDKKEDEIVQESCLASKKTPSMKSAASEDDLTKLAALSPSVKRKIYDYWKNDLKYAPDYCKLLVTDN